MYILRKCLLAWNFNVLKWSFNFSSACCFNVKIGIDCILKHLKGLARSEFLKEGERVLLEINKSLLFKDMSTQLLHKQSKPNISELEYIYNMATLKTTMHLKLLSCVTVQDGSCYPSCWVRYLGSFFYLLNSWANVFNNREKTLPVVLDQQFFL